MNKLFRLMLVLGVCFVIGSCASLEKCNCDDLPGTALIKVFMASDGIPNVNIETLPVYPGQKIVFRGLPEFELNFDLDPQDPNMKNVKFKSKEGKIEIKISKKYQEELDRLARQNKNYAEGLSIKIKYSVIAEGKERDPSLWVIPK